MGESERIGGPVTYGVQGKESWLPRYFGPGECGRGVCCELRQEEEEGFSLLSSGDGWDWEGTQGADCTCGTDIT